MRNIAFEPAQMVREGVGGEVYEFYPLGTYVVRAPGVCGGRPTFKYTRIEVAGVLALVAAGRTLEAIITDYDRPELTRPAIEEAIRLAAKALVAEPPVARAA